MIEIVTKQPETGRGSSYELYDRIAWGLFDVLKPGVRNVKQVSNLLWLVAAIVGGESIALSQIANLLPANAIAQSRVTRIREWLKNSRVDVWALYRRVLERVLDGWNGADMALIMDGTMVFHERLHIVRISMAYGNRAFPLAWQVFIGTGLVSIDPLRPMITRLADFLKPYAGRVTLYADRGFRDHNWAKLCMALDWGYRIRIARSTHIHLRTGAIVQLDALKPRRFRTLCLCHAKLTDHGFGTHVTMTWSRGEGNQVPELVIVMSDQPAHPDRLNEYSVRMDIEQSFRDDKSAGFNIDKTRLVHPERLERLLLAVAIATLWCHETGQFVLQGGEPLRRIIDPGYTRSLSVFQLGLRWIKRCLAVTLNALPPFVLCLRPHYSLPACMVKT
jgi:hypothetical protein